MRVKSARDRDPQASGLGDHAAHRHADQVGGDTSSSCSVRSAMVAVASLARTQHGPALVPLGNPQVGGNEQAARQAASGSCRAWLGCGMTPGRPSS
jgi:hypothetical protein